MKKKTKLLNLSQRASVETLARANLRRGTFTRRIHGGGGKHTLTQVPLTHAVAKRVLRERDSHTRRTRSSVRRSPVICARGHISASFTRTILYRNNGRAPAGDDGFRGTADRPRVRRWRTRGGRAKLA